MRQYVFSPYGESLINETFGVIPPASGPGHQGLFFYPVPGDFGIDPLAAGNHGLYYNRNRWYHPKLGRFLQADVNATALPLMYGASFNASRASVAVGAFSAEAQYGDGLNLFQYLSSNPINMLDPDGLDAFQDDIDDVIASYYGERAAGAAAVMAKAGKAFNMGQQLGYMALTMMPGAGVVELAIKLSDPNKDVGFWDYVGAAGDLGGPIGKLGGKFLKSSFKYMDKLNTGDKRRMSESAGGILGCNCFVEGTLVSTPSGQVPIEEIQVGDDIQTRSHVNSKLPVKPGKVTRLYRSLAPVIMWLTLSNGEVLGTTPGHKVWTHDLGWGYASQLDAGDTFLGEDGLPVSIVAIDRDFTSTPVYNLEVDGEFTYFANGVWVHNKSCELWSDQKWNALTGNAYEDWILGLYGYGKNKRTVRVKNGEHIPDFWEDGIIGDVKFVEKLARSPQLEAIAKQAKRDGLKPVVIVSDSKNTKVSKWVHDHFEVIWGP